MRKGPRPSREPETVIFNLKRTRRMGITAVTHTGGGFLGKTPEEAAQAIVDWCIRRKATIVWVEAMQVLVANNETPLLDGELEKVRAALRRLLPKRIVLEES